MNEGKAVSLNNLKYIRIGNFFLYCDDFDCYGSNKLKVKKVKKEIFSLFENWYVNWSLIKLFGLADREITTFYYTTDPN